MYAYRIMRQYATSKFLSVLCPSEADESASQPVLPCDNYVVRTQALQQDIPQKAERHLKDRFFKLETAIFKTETA
jgi:hypothetical protein